MTNSETISKLNNALGSLIKAYEKSQGEYDSLKARINELEEYVSKLELEKKELEKSVNDFKNNSEADKTNIHSMLGQIETILNKNSKTTTTKTKTDRKETNDSSSSFNLDNSQSILEETSPNEKTKQETKIEEEPNILNIFESSPEPKEELKEEDDNKVDLTDPRLSSLLGINQ